MDFELFGQLTGHPSGEIQNMLVGRDAFGQAQVVLTEDDGEVDETSYVCPIDNWDNPKDAVLEKLKRFPGFENLAWVAA